MSKSQTGVFVFWPDNLAIPCTLHCSLHACESKQKIMHLLGSQCIAHVLNVSYRLQAQLRDQQYGIIHSLNSHMHSPIIAAVLGRDIPGTRPTGKPPMSVIHCYECWPACMHIIMTEHSDEKQVIKNV